jgi:hypothetical protein
MAQPTLNLTRKGGAIRLTLPAKVANDLGALQKGLKSLAERLGHPKCATGCDILHLGLEREFLLTDAARLNPQPLPPANPDPTPWRFEPDPDPWRVTVTIPDKVNNSIDALTKAVAVVVDRLGCKACCSGFDILFRREIGTIALDEQLNVARFGGIR